MCVVSQIRPRKFWNLFFLKLLRGKEAFRLCTPRLYILWGINTFQRYERFRNDSYNTLSLCHIFVWCKLRTKCWRITVNCCKPREAVVLVAAPAPDLVFFSGMFLCLPRHLVQSVILHALLYLFIFLILLFAKTGWFAFLCTNSYTVTTPPTHFFKKIFLFYYILFIYFECRALQACGSQRTDCWSPFSPTTWILGTVLSSSGTSLQTSSCFSTV